MAVTGKGDRDGLSSSMGNKKISKIYSLLYALLDFAGTRASIDRKEQVVEEGGLNVTEPLPTQPLSLSCSFSCSFPSTMDGQRLHLALASATILS